MTEKYYISIDKCPNGHGFYAVSVGNHSTGYRLTPSKCCGSWKSEFEWRLTPLGIDHMIDELTRIKAAIAEND